MELSKYIKHVLDAKGQTLKWLHQQMQSTHIETNTYEYFWNKFKNDKLSAHELIVIASILDIDLNKITSMVKVASQKQKEAFDPLYDWAIQNSSIHNPEAIRLFEKEEDENKLLLITYHVRENWIVVENFINQSHKSKMDKELTLITGTYYHTPESFSSLSIGEKVQMIKDFMATYAVLYPEYYEEDMELKPLVHLGRAEKMLLMFENSEFKDQGNNHYYYFDVKKKYKDLAGKDVLITLNLETEFFAIEWFDFQEKEVRTLVKSEQMFAGEPISQEKEAFPNYNSEERLASLYAEYQDYRMNVISDEEYDQEYPIRSLNL